MQKEVFVGQKRVILFLTLAITFLGVVTYLIMPREEDPKIKRRQAITSVLLPGASPEKIQRTIVKPIEDELLKVQDLKTVEVEIRLNVAVFKLELKDGVKSISEAWQEVERALDKSQAHLPPNFSRPILDFSVISVESVVLAITGTKDPVQLTDAAKKVKDRLMENSQVSEVKIFGDPGLEVLVSVDSARLFSNGISIPQLLAGLQQNNLAQETGLIIQEGSKYVLHQDNDAELPQKLGAIKFETGQLDTVTLSQFSKISRTSSAEPKSIFRWNGKPAVGLGVVANDSLDTVKFGQELMKNVDEVKKEISPLTIETVAYQPDRTSRRLNDLMFSLFSGMGLIALFLALTSSSSMALIVSICVPLISAIGLFVYYLNGGILHQISIAAFVISIGQFIDNIIVIVDSIQQKMKSGMSKLEAAIETREQMRWPMAFATLTGICAFLPMLASEGATADFTYSLPQIAIITLICSYFVAIYFVPLISEFLLRDERKPLIQLPLEKMQNFFVHLAIGSKVRISLIVASIFVVSMISLVQIKKDFFPESDRNEFLFSAELSPSTDIQVTDRILSEVEQTLARDPRVKSVASFSGGGIPRFYYNLPNPQRSPQIGQILVTTHQIKEAKAVGLDLEKQFKSKYPDQHFTAHFLQQGPPVNAKIEFNVFSENTQRRSEIISQIENILKSEDGARSIRPDASFGLNTLNLESQESTLADIGFNRAQLNSILAYYSSGVPISSYRFDRDLIPIVVRDSKGLYRSTEELLQQKAFRGRSQDYKITDLVQVVETNEKPILRKENGRSFSRILSDLQPNYTYSTVMQSLNKKINQISLLPGESISFGGDAKGADEANSSIFRVVPLAFTLLILFLLIEFKSFRKLMIAVLALPVTIMGVFPGLWLSGAPFGFMSLLGLLALVGVAINNIILLMEALDHEESVAAAIQIRFRSIFLTTTLTLLGLIPLALEDSSLWPPLAWTMISGLITGTVATLIVVPALYQLFIKSRRSTAGVKNMNTLMTSFLIFLAASFSFKNEVQAEPRIYSLEQVMDLSNKTDEYEIQKLNVDKSKIQNDQDFRDVYVPKVYLGGQAYKRDKDLKIATPFGDTLQEEKDGFAASVELRQTLFDYSKMFHRADARNRSASAEQLKLGYVQDLERLKSAEAAIEILTLKREKSFIEDSIQNLVSRSKDMRRLILKGRLSKSDLLKVEVAIEKLKQQNLSLDIKISAKKSHLQKNLGLEDFDLLQPEKISRLNLPTRSESTGDIDYLKEQSQSLQKTAQQIRYAGGPVVEAYYKATTVDGNLLTTKQWDEAGLSLKWEVFGGGVRQAQSNEVRIESQQLEKRAAELERNLQVQFAELQQEALRSYQWIKQIDVLSEKALQNKKIEEIRYYEGRGNLNDLVEADNLHLELKRDQDIISFQTLLNCMRLKLWAGHKIAPNCEVNDKKGDKH